MKHFKFITLVKILLIGTKIYPIAPIILSPDHRIDTWKNLRLFYTGTSFPIAVCLLYYYLFGREQTELRTDPYSMLGYIRAIFSSVCPFLTFATVLTKCEYLTSSIRILINLQTTLKLSGRKLNLIFGVIIFQLILLYSANGVWIFLLFSPKIKNFYLRIAISVSNGILNVSMIACEFFYLNEILLITEFVKMINKQLKQKPSSSGKIAPIAW